MEQTPKVIEFPQILNPMNDDIEKIEKEIEEFKSNNKKQRQEINELQQRLAILAREIEITIDDIPSQDEAYEALNTNIDSLLVSPNLASAKYTRFPKLSKQDTIVCSLAGIISILIDVIFVGTPEVVKIYKAGENFDGSILTGALRKIGNDGNNNLSLIFEWFSDKCKVPYDIPLKSGVLTPNNHRLRSLAHDPFFGLLFAVADIILGTTTCIDNNGKLNVIVNPNKAPTEEKWLAVIYYLGHIISDMCTARGIPIPGFFITQFFTAEIGDDSIARIAESMYRDGYDLRHMASMSVPVFVKDMLINLYLKLTRESSSTIISISERESYELGFQLKTYKMKIIANSIATIGNTIKFVAPPNYGNPCALNMVQWLALIQSGITMVVASSRDYSAEEAIYNRKSIDRNWEGLVLE